VLIFLNHTFLAIEVTGLCWRNDACADEQCLAGMPVGSDRV